MNNHFGDRKRLHVHSLNLEQLEPRLVLDGVAAVDSGIFIFLDNDGNETNNVTGSIVGGNLQIHDANNDIIAGPGVTQVDSQTVSVPLGNFNTFLAQLKGGSDSLTLPAGLTKTAIVQGDGGNDTITGGGGSDVLLGDDGDDTINGGEGADVIFGGIGNDNLSGGGGEDVIVGWQGDLNDIPGSIANVGSDTGNDTINGGSGGDILRGGFGNDTINGDGEGDTIEGNDGVDQLNGGTGNDTIIGGNGGDTLNGGDNDDVLLGEGGADNISGDAGNDLIDGGAEGDTLNGNANNDIIFGGFGADTINGGAGEDVAVGWEANLMDVAGSLANPGADTSNDTINGDGENDLLRGGFGNDTVNGGAGNDNVLGDDGDDSLIGEGGNDTLIGGNGADNLSGGDNDDLISGGIGNDTITGGAGVDVITGDAGADNIQGQAGDDVIDGGADGDTIDGGTENDIIFGGLGNDTIIGGSGNDTIAGWEANLADIPGSLANPGTDTGNDSITGGQGTDVLRGGSGDDYIDGGDDADNITGDGGNDTLTGEGGDDTLIGGAGNDLMGGGLGNDVLLPGTGNDAVYGDSSYVGGVLTPTPAAQHGNDVFVWLNGDDADFLFGEGGTDLAQVLLDTGVIPAAGLFIDMGDNADPNRDTINVITGAGARTPLFVHTDALPSGLVIAGLGGGIITSNSEQINYVGDAANNDAAAVIGTIHDDDLTVAPLSPSQALVFLGGNPWDGPSEGSFFDQFPGVAGGGVGPDLNLNGIAGVTVNGGSTDGVGDRLYLYSTSENDLVDPASQGANVNFGYGDGVIVPGAFNAVNPLVNGFDVISVTEQRISVTNNGTALVPVDIVGPSFTQVDPNRKGLIVNSGFETAFGGNGVADDITANFSFNYAIQINGGDPDPNASPADPIPPFGDRLQIESQGDINLANLKTDPDNITLFTTGSKKLNFSSIESIVLTPSNGSRTINLIGDNDDPLVDQEDEFVVRGQNIDSTLGQIANAPPQFQPDPDGTNELTVVLSGSQPLSARNVQFLNALGDDSTFASIVPAVDTLDISAYADNTTNGWGIDVFFYEGPPDGDGAPADLLIYRTSIFGRPASEQIVVRPSAQQAGKLTVTNAVNGSLIVDIDYLANTDILIFDDDGVPTDNDTLTLQGTENTNPATTGVDLVVANLATGGTAGNPLIAVRDGGLPGAPVLYNIQNVTGITAINIETLSGIDRIEVQPSPVFTVDINGGTPVGGISSIIGDTLFLNSLEPFVFQKGPDISSGTFIVLPNKPITFENIERLETASSTDPGSFYRPPGPWVDNIVIPSAPGYDLFDPNPADGPTPLFNALDITFKASQFGLAGLFAVDLDLATIAGNYSLVGDRVGAIFIDSATVIGLDVTGDPTVTVRLVFSEIIPDDRYTFTIQDDITDPLGNRLDGDVRGTGSPGNPIFPSGDGNPGTDFVARFTVDARPEVGVYSAPEIYIDANNNHLVDPQGSGDASNSDLFYLLQLQDASGNLLQGGFGLHDTLFSGKFVLNNGVANGFDSLGAYGTFNGSKRWIIDVNGDGVIKPSEGDFFGVQAALPGFNLATALPVTGDFNLNPADGDEIGLFDGTTWYLDTNGDNIIAANDFKVTSLITGFPLIGDFDGDFVFDLATWKNDVFSIDLASNGLGVGPVFNINFSVPGVSELPVVADMDRDGIDDLGLFNYATSEWSFLISNNFGNPPTPGSVSTLNHTFSPQTVGGDDLFFRYGIGRFAAPIVGNFNSRPLNSGIAPFMASAEEDLGPLPDGDEEEEVASYVAEEESAESTGDSFGLPALGALIAGDDVDEAAIDGVFDSVENEAATDSFSFDLLLLGVG